MSHETDLISEFGPLSTPFIAAFRCAWKKFLDSERGARLPELFRTEWTKQSIGLRGSSWKQEDDSALPLFVAALKRYDEMHPSSANSADRTLWSRIRREENYIDLLLASPQPPLIGNHWGYPAGYDVLLEHEFSGTDIETEMWKLLFFHGRLKVIVAYDDFGEPRNGGAWRSTWIPGKITQLREMWRRVANHRTDEEYLLLIGRRTDADGGFASWRAVRLSAPKEDDPQGLGLQIWPEESTVS